MEAINDEEQRKEKKGKDQEVQKVALYKLFTFADKKDVVLMIVGSLAAVATGLAQPIMTLFFGDVIDVFGRTSPNHIVEKDKISIKFHTIENHKKVYMFMMLIILSCN